MNYPQYLEIEEKGADEEIEIGISPLHLQS
jgi:hypothetical protein